MPTWVSWDLGGQGSLGGVASVQEPGFLGKPPYPVPCLAARRMLVLPRMDRVWTTLQDRDQLCLVPHAYPRPILGGGPSEGDPDLRTDSGYV